MQGTISNAKLLHSSTGGTRLMDKLNGEWHERGLQLFTAIVLAHWAEHLMQAYQVYYLKWPIPQARGVLGYWYPWLVKSETLHYGYALVMLVGLWIFRTGFVGVGRRWWMIAFWIQFWHHIEHGLLQVQVLIGLIVVCSRKGDASKNPETIGQRGGRPHG